MKVMNKKHLRLFLLAVLSAFCIGQAVGQNILKYQFVGKDQTVLYNCSSGYIRVTLGNPEEAPGANEEEVQYYWTVEHSESDGNVSFQDFSQREQPIAKIYITSESGVGSFVFSCTRTSKYGYQKEYVTVTLKNTIETMVKAKNDCWAHGDDITEDQFEITTNPPGYEEHVILDLDSKKAENFVGPIHDKQTLHFVSDDPSRYPIEDKDVIIDVIRAGYSQGISVGGNESLPKMIQALKEGGTFLEKMKRIEDATEPFKKFSGLPVKLDFPHDFHVGVSGGMECCNGGEARFVDLSGGGYIGVNFELDFPVPPCPFVHLFVGLTASFTLNFAGYRWTYHTECDDCDCGGASFLDFRLGGELYGGVSIEAGSRDFLSVSGTITGGLDWGGKFFFANEKNPNQDLVQMDDKIHLYGKVGVKVVLVVTSFSAEATLAEY